MPGSSVSSSEAYTLLASGQAPAGLCVHGTLDYSVKSKNALPPAFPEDFQVELLDLTGQPIEALPSGLRAWELNLSETLIRKLPDDIMVTSRLNLARCDRLENLPDRLAVGTLVLRGCTGMRALPEGLDVWFLDLSGCWALDHWPQTATIRGGQLQLRTCTALRELPSYVNRLSALNVRECPNLTQLPANLVVTGWLELAHSGLTNEEMLPDGLAETQLRWAGVNVDRRIVFHPQSIRIDEVLGERNAERRRVLLDRYGYGRFLQDAAAEILDSDRDPGGKRQLLRVALVGDEDLVAMSCFCPSTGRQYIIRVPPQTRSCRHAAAWIAGFDNPDDYRPIEET